MCPWTARVIMWRELIIRIEVNGIKVFKTIYRSVAYRRGVLSIQQVVQPLSGMHCLLYSNLQSLGMILPILSAFNVFQHHFTIAFVIRICRHPHLLSKTTVYNSCMSSRSRTHTCTVRTPEFATARPVPRSSISGHTPTVFFYANHKMTRPRFRVS